jgi:hypothetical protein
MIHNSKNKKLQDFLILYVLLDMKNNILEFRYILQKTLCHGKTAITFAYDVGLKSFLYEKYLREKLHQNLTTYDRFDNFYNPQIQKEK